MREKIYSSEALGFFVRAAILSRLYRDAVTTGAASASACAVYVHNMLTDWDNISRVGVTRASKTKTIKKAGVEFYSATAVADDMVLADRRPRKVGSAVEARVEGVLKAHGIDLAPAPEETAAPVKTKTVHMDLAEALKSPGGLAGAVHRAVSKAMEEDEPSGTLQEVIDKLTSANSMVRNGPADGLREALEKLCAGCAKEQNKPVAIAAKEGLYVAIEDLREMATAAVADAKTGAHFGTMYLGHIMALSDTPLFEHGAPNPNSVVARAYDRLYVNMKFMSHQLLAFDEAKSVSVPARVEAAIQVAEALAK